MVLYTKTRDKSLTVSRAERRHQITMDAILISVQRRFVSSVVFNFMNQ